MTMRIRNLFYLLLALPLVFAACETNDSQTDKPVEKVAVLSLTSDIIMEFEAEGGQGEITYTVEWVEVSRTSPVPEPEVEVTCEADWVTITTADLEKCNFTVAANEGEARNAKIVVKYATEVAEVAVKQAAKEEKPEPQPTTFEYELVSAERMSAEDVGYTLYPYDFPIAFSGVEGENGADFAIWLVGQEGDMTLQAGEYSLEAENVIIDFCAVFTADEIMAEDIVVKVAVEGDVYDFDITLYDAEGNIHHATYSGEVENMTVGGDEPVAFEPVKVTAELFSTGNFMLQLWIDDMYYHELDMYDNINPNNDYLSEGVYSYADGSIGSWSIFSLGNDTSCSLADAEVTVAHNDDNSVNIAGYIISSEGHHILFDWSGEVDGFNFASDDVEFVAQFFGGEYYEGPRHNYYFVLSDVEADGNPAVEGATYYYFDVYSDELNENYTLPNGVYTFDITNSYAAGTFTEEYGFAFYAGGSQDTVWYMYDEGSTLTVTDGKIVAELLMQDGSKHIVTYEGDLSCGAAGGSELTEDMEINVSGWTIFAEYYDQYYSNDTDNWYVSIYEDFESGSGRYFVLDLLADFATSVDYRGTFTASDSCGINTFMPGYIDDGYLAGSWYAEIEDGSVSGIMAPLTDGTITVTYNGDGTQTFAFDCRNDLGYKITGTVQGAPLAGGYAAEIGGKRSLVVNTPEKMVINF